MQQVIQRFSDRLSDVKELVSRTNKSSVLVVQQFPVESDTNTLIPAVRESVSNILAFIELGDPDVLREVIELADGVVDCVVFDNDLKCKRSAELIDIARTKFVKSRLFFYSDNNTWADSALELIQQLGGGLAGKKILLGGNGALHKLMAQKLVNASALVNSPDATSGNENMYAANEAPDIIVGAGVKSISISESSKNLVQKGTLVFDVGIGNFSRELIAHCMTLGAPVYRVDIRAGISSAVLGILETDYLIRNIMGRTVLNGVELVAGGVMGNKGAIIVDDINKPAYIIGVADGQGNVKDPGAEDDAAIAFVNRLIGNAS